MGFTQLENQNPLRCTGRVGSVASRFELNREKALELFACKGFGQVSLRELASHLGLAAGSLYHHCSSKEELLFEFIEEYYEGVLAVSTRLAGCGASGERLRRLVAALIELHRDQPLRFRLATKERHCLTPAHQQRIDELQQRCQEHWLRKWGWAPIFLRVVAWPPGTPCRAFFNRYPTGTSTPGSLTQNARYTWKA